MIIFKVQSCYHVLFWNFYPWLVLKYCACHMHLRRYTRVCRIRTMWSHKTTYADSRHKKVLEFYYAEKQQPTKTWFPNVWLLPWNVSGWLFNLEGTRSSRIIYRVTSWHSYMQFMFLKALWLQLYLLFFLGKVYRMSV